LPAADEHANRGRPERIGLLGGTFDPPHCGHVAAAVACVDALDLDRLLLVVANHPWQKTPLRTVSPAEDRVAMVEAAAAGRPRLEVSRLEIDRGGPSYTIETVEELLGEARGEQRPAPEVFMVVGADLVESLPTWERVGELARLVTLVVVSRPRSPTPQPPAGWRSAVVATPGIDVSSSEVRTLLAQGRPVGGLVPEAVIRCIHHRDLYAVWR